MIFYTEKISCCRWLLLRKEKEDKFSFEDTYKAMANESEDWEDLNVTLSDGFESEDFDN
ncbi:MAG: hypothetical protein J7K90_08295 [Desulfuromusa sp.]|nr:hypothetical protein [Desulfuromusa sp.]